MRGHISCRFRLLPNACRYICRDYTLGLQSFQEKHSRALIKKNNYASSVLVNKKRYKKAFQKFVYKILIQMLLLIRKHPRGSF